MSERETAWTPGPWFLQTRGADVAPPPGFSLPGVAVFATALDNHDIRTRYGDDNFICGMWSVITDEDRANARLIAAAPELYEAVRLFVEYDSENDDGVAFMRLYDEAIRAARSALSKASQQQGTGE